jgi:hypothetical protein
MNGSSHEMIIENPPASPSELFHSPFATFWHQLKQNYPSTDDTSNDIWNSIKWTITTSIVTNSEYCDSINLVGKYSFDESWTEAFATLKNADVWKKNVIDHIQKFSSKNYAVKVEIGGTKKQVGKGEGLITVQIHWSPTVKSGEKIEIKI